LIKPIAPDRGNIASRRSYRQRSAASPCDNLANHFICNNAHDTWLGLRVQCLRLHGREVAMNTPVIAVIIVVALIFGSALSILNKACKSGYHTGALQFPPRGIVQKLSRLREYFTTK